MKNKPLSLSFYAGWQLKPLNPPLATQHLALYQLTPDRINSQTICSTIIHPKCNIIPIDIWLFRMVHPSPERLQCMHSYYPILRNKKNFTCNTCHYAKHKRLPFSSSNSHALHSFDLLHIDMWGPCSKSSMHGHRYFFFSTSSQTRIGKTSLYHSFNVRVG